jgi:SCY1-like protein 2
VILNEGDAIPQVGFQPKGLDGEQNGVESSSTIKGNSPTWDSQTWNSTTKSDPVSIKASWGADDWSSVDSSTGSVLPTKELHSEGIGLPKGSSVSYNASSTSLPDKTNSSFEWPPPASQSSMKSQSINIASSLNMPMPNVGDQRAQSIDEFDPFADWPPRSNTSAGVSMTGSKSASLNQSSVSSLSMLNGGTIPIGGANRKNEIDISSFFSQGTTQPEAQPRKLAPPPAGLGKGQGRNPIRPIRSPQSTSKSGPVNPPLMDLL